MSRSEHLSCSILLDDAHSAIDNPTSRLYQHPIQYIEAHSPQELDLALSNIEAAIAHKKYVVSCLSYELGEHFVGVHPRPSSTPWIRAWIFESVSKLSKDQADQWLQKQRLESKSNQLAKIDQALIPSMTAPVFKNKIKAIQELIKNGDTYQVNFTYRISGAITGEPVSLYQNLRGKQPGPFGAYIEHSDGWILSCSPEWFLSKQGSRLITKPMKGTGKVGEMSSASLSADPKNRAENLMIVDLLRNDFSKISKAGSVKVPQLFQVDQHGDVLQMTSTIESIAKDNLSLKELLSAIFPCGSITGAPKKRTMEIIQELEDQPRNLYCGSIAWFDPIPDNNDSHDSINECSKVPYLGNIGMSVVIRTLEVNKERELTMGVGGGITIDSDAESEWHECQTKANFLYQLESTPGLFETIRIEHGQACHLEHHLERLEQSSITLGNLFDRKKALNLVQSACEGLSDTQLIYRMRLELSSQGQLSVAIHPTKPLPSSSQLLWAQDLFDHDVTSNSKNPWFNHKVTERAIYDDAWSKAEQKGAFDALFVNELGYVTEGGRSNLFIKKNGQWQTPPIDSGCLPGVMRSLILNDPAWGAIEANIKPEDVLSAEEIIFCNALRGIISVNLAHPAEYQA
jgi:para-aminobenzoate synthetase/4-amino-4-deoxychorismate lyase